jgi:hypothetical protein
MKLFKYNFFELAPPKGYRWIKLGERILDEDIWFEENSRYNLTTALANCNTTLHSTMNFPIPRDNNQYGGYCRKI